jgi:hypothetical protein
MALNEQTRVSSNKGTIGAKAARYDGILPFLTNNDPDSTLTNVNAIVIDRHHFDGQSSPKMLKPTEHSTDTESIQLEESKNQKPSKKVATKKIPHEIPSSTAAANPIVPNMSFLTVKQTAERFPIFTEAAIRDLIFQAEGYAKYPDSRKRSSGFLKVIIRIPGQRRILICEQALIDWIRTGRHE